MGVSLAWWHNYKWASFRIMNVFGADFIGGFFHALFPDTAFDINKMSFPSVTTLLSYIRLAYSDFVVQLDTAIAAPRSARSAVMLGNLKALCGFFIPVVCLLLFAFYQCCSCITMSTQVQDFYLSLKFNKGQTAITSLLRLFIACCMLNNVKVPGRRSPHPYPKIQLAYLLVLSYWKKVSHYPMAMLSNNTGIFNEELGEISFSILARAVLGDSVKDNFEHMSRVYRLLPVYRDLKNDVFSDQAVSTSLSWRHRIDANGPEVLTARLFFSQCITRIQQGTYRSYPTNFNMYGSRRTITPELTTDYLPDVWMTRGMLAEYMASTCRQIEIDFSGYVLYLNRDIWPEAKVPHVAEEGDIDFEDDDVDGQPAAYSSDGEEKLHVQPEHPAQNDDEHHQIQEIDGPPVSPVSASPYLNRSWAAWGSISSENQMLGTRPRISPSRFLPTKRRIVYISPRGRGR